MVDFVGGVAFIILLFIGMSKEDPWITLLAAMIPSMLALNIYNNGFLNMTNPFLKNGIIAILSALGLYLITSVVNYMEVNYGS